MSPLTRTDRRVSGVCMHATEKSVASEKFASISANACITTIIISSLFLVAVFAVARILRGYSAASQVSFPVGC